MGDNLFLFYFTDLMDRKKVLQGRPWLLGKVLVVVQEFESDKQLGHIQFDRSPFWVRVA